MYLFSLSSKTFTIRLQIFFMLLEKAFVFLVTGKAYWVGSIAPPQNPAEKDKSALPVDARIFELSQVDKIYERNSLND
ncbi:hypothetical protein [Vibrio furnissii]|uniref:hypothetical protein n=1 Tax=Vibrio furnissii TaxID=29494 RepID=UPI001E4D9AA8|nr:hypothetical protein [Vibrio furnissii]UHJ62223.1 hypothetical protein LUM42_21645 [Vibrio furnissii]